MAKAKGSTNKTAFVLQLPKKLPAKDVVQRAKKQGLRLNEKYVYVVRSNAKRRAGLTKASRRSRSTTKTREPRTETQFRRLAIELGLGRAERLLSDTKRKVANIIAGS